MITETQLVNICPSITKTKIPVICSAINEAMRIYEINTRLRVCSFIAQLAHESGSFYYTKELASGSAYEGRKDLGNIHPGDGVKYKGRGYIQITGRSNYEACSKAFGLDLLTKPELLEQPKYAAESAGWFWKTHGLNELADANDFEKITKKINGGLNGYAQRQEFYKKALLTIK